MDERQQTIFEQVAQAGEQARQLRERARSVTLKALKMARAAGLPQRKIASALHRSQPEVSRLLKLIPARFQPASPLGEILAAKRHMVYRAIEESGASNPRVFGSVARGEDIESSDIDLLIDIPESFSLGDLARLQSKVEQILGHAVDVIPARGLHGRVAATVFGDAVTL